MNKRVLVNLNPPGEEPHWAFVPKRLVDLTKPIIPPKPRKTRHVYKAFANPRSHGYGGHEAPWPFDRQKAINDGRYRAGIRNAINSEWTASNWKFVAKRELLQLLDDEIKKYQ